MSTLRTLQSADFDNLLALAEAQAFALNDTLNKLKEAKKSMKSGTFERALTRQEISDATGDSLSKIDRLARTGKIKKHYMGVSTPKMYLSEYQAALKKS